MNQLLLKLFGSDTGEGGTISGSSIAFHPTLPPLVLGILFAFLILLTIAFYRRTPSDVKGSKIFGMALLRVLFFGLLLLLLLRPVLSVDMEAEKKRALPILVDTSASMGIADIRESEDDLRRATTVLGTDSTNPRPSRTDLVRAAFANSDLNLLPPLEKDLDVSFYRFDKDFAEIPTGEEGLTTLEPTGPETALGNTLRGLLNRRRGEALAGIVLATDGVTTTGENARDAAQALREAGVPLYIYGPGVTVASDLAIDGVEVPEASLAEDAVPVTVRVRARGMAGKSARVILTLGGVQAADKEVTFEEDGIVEVPLAFLPKVAGDFKLEATVETSAPEVVADNNSWSRQLRVLDSQLRVLMIEQTPRWEFKYIQALLLREKRVDVDCLVFEADREVTRAPGSPFIEQFPQRREDLFGYDLILFGDVDPRSLQPAQIENLAAFVSEAGGALIVIAGKAYTPQAYRHSALENLFPVEIEPASIGGLANAASTPITLELTSAGLANPMLQLEDSAEASVARWKQMPPIYWTAPVVRAKPAAEVLLVDSRASRDGKKPIVALQRYGAGEVLFIGTENTWRWRKNVGDLYHTVFWSQVVQRMAGSRLLAGSRRTRLNADRQSYTTGDRITVFAKLQTDSYDPVREEAVRATLEDENGVRREVLLRGVPDQAGFFRAEFSAPGAGRYRLTVDNDPGTPLDLSVREPDQEMADPAMNEAALRELAEITGGRFFREDDLAILPAAITNRTAKVTTQREIELWASPLSFILLMLLLTGEWVLRKFSELK